MFVVITGKIERSWLSYKKKSSKSIAYGNQPKNGAPKKPFPIKKTDPVSQFIDGISEVN